MIEHHTTDDIRAKALWLLRRGEATVAEIAQIAETSRQRVQYWADVANIDAGARRTARLAQLWRAARNAR